MEEFLGLLRYTSLSGGHCRAGGHRHSCSEPFLPCHAGDQAPELLNAPER